MKPIWKLIIAMALVLAAVTLRGPDGGTNRTPITVTR
jgi:hypothetical protein